MFGSNVFGAEIAAFLARSADCRSTGPGASPYVIAGCGRHGALREIASEVSHSCTWKQLQYKAIAARGHSVSTGPHCVTGSTAVTAE